MYIFMYILGMTHRYSIAEARSQLARIIDEAQAGQEIELTRRGKPVAVVVSCREMERLRGERPEFGERYDAFLSGTSLEELGVDDDFAASVRSGDPGRRVSL